MMRIYTNFINPVYDSVIKIGKLYPMANCIRYLFTVIFKKII